MTMFVTIMVVGFVVLLFSFIIGELAEHGGDLAHDVVVEHDVFDHGGEVEHSHGGPSIFSLRMVASFVTGFGGGGAVGRYYDLSYLVSSFIGLAGALVLGGIVYFIVSFLYKQQATSGMSMFELKGKPATVSVAIPTSGLGQVTLTHKGKTVTHTAKGADGKAKERGALVNIKEVVGDYVIVE